MSAVLSFLISLIVIGTLGLMCLFLCILADNKKEIWSLILGKENKNERRWF